MKQTQNTQNFAESMIWKQCKEYEVVKWNYHKKQFEKTKIDVIIIQDNYLVHCLDGVILRKQLIQNDPQNLEILSNIEQIKQLIWFGNSAINKRKQGKWIATWNGEVLSEIGGYFENGQRKGLWKELFKNYCSQAKVYESGEYQNDKRCGIWIYIYDNNKIGDGQYNEQGQKNGKWIEPSNGFNCNSQLTYHGEYREGQKFGRWDIWYKNQQIGKNEQIGGGQYDEGCGGTKIGSWIEANDEFNDFSQITYNGEFQNGRKIGRWDINLNHKGVNKQIGGGSYDERGDGIKIGKWIELSQGFYESSQVMFSGDYKNGNKVGRWDIYFNNKGGNEKIGGGSYDESSEGKKIGSWIEVNDKFNDSSQITYNGEYQNGRKIGRWDINFKNTGGNDNIHGQQNNEGGDRTKIGRKVISDSVGKNGKKAGRQDTHFDTKGGNEKIGGSYDDGGEELKIGRWTEPNDSNSQFTYVGEYKNGQKVGKWDIFFLNRGVNKEMGGGFYEKEVIGLKIGKWIELSDFNSQLTYIGEYKKGQKVARWDTYFNYFGNKQIGGGSYDEGGEGIKIGRWIEVNDDFFDSSQVTLNGEYKNGYKVGRWDIYFNYGENIKIGGGSYDQEGTGIKIGKWVEIKDGFKWALQTTFNGEYANGKKIGTWVEMQGNLKSKEINFDH